MAQVAKKWGQECSKVRLPSSYPSCSAVLCRTLSVVRIRSQILILLRRVMAVNGDSSWMASFVAMRPKVQRRPWMMVGAWLGRKILDPAAQKPCREASPCYWHLVNLAEISLSPLTTIMEPLVRQGAYYQKNIFERFLQRALWSPVSKYKVLALGIPAAYFDNGRAVNVLGCFW